jgi:hypothetical protein
MCGTGACVQCGAIVWLLLWRHSHDVTWTYFVVAALWGLSDGIWQTQINGKHLRPPLYHNLFFVFVQYNACYHTPL